MASPCLSDAFAGLCRSYDEETKHAWLRVQALPNELTVAKNGHMVLVPGNHVWLSHDAEYTSSPGDSTEWGPVRCALRRQSHNCGFSQAPIIVQMVVLCDQIPESLITQTALAVVWPPREARRVPQAWEWPTGSDRTDGARSERAT